MFEHIVLIPLNRKCTCIKMVALLVAMLVHCGCNNNASDSNNDDVVNDETLTQSEKMSSVQRLVSSEEFILDLTKRLKPLNRAALNMSIPSGQAKTLFDASCHVYDLKGLHTDTTEGYFSKSKFDIEQVKSTEIWSAFFAQAKYLETAKFYIIDGELAENNQSLFSNMGFASHFVDQENHYCHAKAKIEVVWRRPDADKSPKIVEWKTKEFVCYRVRKKMFESVIDQVVTDEVLVFDLENSEQEILTETILMGKPAKTKQDDPYKMFSPEVTLEHPAVSIVDFNKDGWDDFFVCRQHRSPLMFQNQRDGTFKEVSEDIGLGLEYDCTCALFADFDNDGDQDVFIGRSRHRALFFENEDGFYLDSTNLIDGVELPYMVSSISAADFDNDGLLDVYFSTYSPIEGSHANVLRTGNLWPQVFLDVPTRIDFEEKLKKAHPYINMVGPPNLLLRNKGGGFQLSSQNQEVESWRKSFQSSWCDFDQDGDQDLYVCNDFSPDDLYRNEGGRFVRISDQIGLNRLGFGMGVSFNDFNNDGHIDLYVSNMFSKAGTRITRQLDGLDDQIRQMADGNYLYEFDGDTFKLVSVDGPQQTTAVTGWSWGGQFNDLDNDGRLDIVVANGYYTAPASVAGDVDL